MGGERRGEERMMEGGVWDDGRYGLGIGVECTVLSSTLMAWRMELFTFFV